MALTVTVYKDPHGDFTNGGASAGVNEILVVNANGPTDPKHYPDRPTFLLVKGNVPGALKLVPAVDAGDGTYVEKLADGMCGPMFGGNYGDTSDSRFGELSERLVPGTRFHGAVPIHDRYETWAEYEALSR